MAQQEYSDFQKKVISKYYNHLDVIMLQKLQELVSELYLADTEAKQKRLWERVRKAMVNLRVPTEIMEHILGRRDVEILARNLQDWLRQSQQK